MSGGPTLPVETYWWHSTLAASGYVSGSQRIPPTDYGTVLPESYMHATAVFACPSYQAVTIWPNGSERVTPIGADYGLNGHIAGFIRYTNDIDGVYGDTRRHQLHQVLRPSEAIMAGDIQYHTNQSGSLQNNASQFQFDERHERAANISFFDGHVQTFPEPFGTIQGYGSEDNRYWAADGKHTNR